MLKLDAIRKTAVGNVQLRGNRCIRYLLTQPSVNCTGTKQSGPKEDRKAVREPGSPQKDGNAVQRPGSPEDHGDLGALGRTEKLYGDLAARRRT